MMESILKFARRTNNFRALVRNRIKFLLKYGTFDFFNDINIETITSCNRRCEYCPNSIFERGSLKNEKLMKSELFVKIIDELAEINFDGRISPQFYGEPLLDPRLKRFIEISREKLPKVNIKIFSNGDFLTIDKYKELLRAGVTSFYITQHSETVNKNLKELFRHTKKIPGIKAKIKLKRFGLKEPMFNRGGLVDPQNLKTDPRCRDGDNPLVIDYQGNVILCCNDYHSTVRFGNLEDQGLLEIW
ncbi:MAG: radical SAM/SPASM domain-containing protein, partial [Candidatus Hodarchaeales archaeon]